MYHPKWDVINVLGFCRACDTKAVSDGRNENLFWPMLLPDYYYHGFQERHSSFTKSGCKKIVISIGGGYQGYFSLTTDAARNTFSE